MPTPFEAEIHSLFLDLGDASLVADDLLRRWSLNILSEQEQEECALFLIQSGIYSRFFVTLRQALDANAKFPWAPLIESLAEIRAIVTAEQWEAILEGARSQNAEVELARSTKLAKSLPGYQEIRARLLSQRALQLEERRKEIKEKIQFMRQARLFEEEAKALRELQAVFPLEKEIAVEREAFEVRWAREVISRSTHQATTPTVDLSWRIEKLSPEQKTSKKLIVERGKEMALERPQSAYDIALALHFMDFNAEALEVLDQAYPREEGALGLEVQSAPEKPPEKLPEKPTVFSVDWLRLELMLHARQFLHALEEAGRLELVYAGDPETAFSVVYARARALKGLGQDSMAIELLKSLVKIRPHYKSAQSLLNDWLGGD